MAETYLVQLDVAQLRAQRGRVEQRDMSDTDICLWLVNAGFYPRIDGLFLAEHAVLEQLDPCLIVTAKPVEPLAVA